MLNILQNIQLQLLGVTHAADVGRVHCRDAKALSATRRHEAAHAQHRDPLGIWRAQIITDLPKHRQSVSASVLSELSRQVNPTVEIQTDL